MVKMQKVLMEKISEKERHIEKDCGWGEWKSESCQIGLVGIGKNDRALMSSDAK